jgi:hypothetical protein
MAMDGGWIVADGQKVLRAGLHVLLQRTSS